MRESTPLLWGPELELDVVDTQVLSSKRVSNQYSGKSSMTGQSLLNLTLIGR